MKYLLSIPDELHKEIKHKAIDVSKSMNQYILDCLDLFLHGINYQPEQPTPSNMQKMHNGSSKPNRPSTRPPKGN